MQCSPFQFAPYFSCVVVPECFLCDAGGMRVMVGDDGEVRETRVLFLCVVFFFPFPCVCCLLWFGFNPLGSGEQQGKLPRVWKPPA